MDELRLQYIEDETDICDIVSFTLQGAGFDLQLYASTVQANDEGGDFRRYLKLLDVIMPRIDAKNNIKTFTQNGRAGACRYDYANN